MDKQEFLDELNDISNELQVIETEETLKSAPAAITKQIVRIDNLASTLEDSIAEDKAKEPESEG